MENFPKVSSRFSETIEAVEGEARERQILLAGTRPNKDLTEKIPEGNKTSAEQIAEMFGTNERYRITQKSGKIQGMFMCTCKIKPVRGLYMKSYFRGFTA